MQTCSFAPILLISLLCVQGIGCTKKEHSTNAGTTQDENGERNIAAKAVATANTNARFQQAMARYEQECARYKDEMVAYGVLMRRFDADVTQWERERQHWDEGEREKAEWARREERLGGGLAPLATLIGKKFPKPYPRQPVKPTEPRKPTYVTYPKRLPRSAFQDSLLIGSSD